MGGVVVCALHHASPQRSRLSFCLMRRLGGFLWRERPVRGVSKRRLERHCLDISAVRARYYRSRCQIPAMKKLFGLRADDTSLTHTSFSCLHMTNFGICRPPTQAVWGQTHLITRPNRHWGAKDCSEGVAGRPPPTPSRRRLGLETTPDPVRSVAAGLVLVTVATITARLQSPLEWAVEPTSALARGPAVRTAVALRTGHLGETTAAVAVRATETVEIFGAAGVGRAAGTGVVVVTGIATGGRRESGSSTGSTARNGTGIEVLRGIGLEIGTEAGIENATVIERDPAPAALT